MQVTLLKQAKTTEKMVAIKGKKNKETKVVGVKKDTTRQHQLTTTTTELGYSR